jgi:hypothetical protein
MKSRNGVRPGGKAHLEGMVRKGAEAPVAPLLPAKLPKRNRKKRRRKLRGSRELVPHERKTYRKSPHPCPIKFPARTFRANNFHPERSNPRDLRVRWVLRSGLTRDTRSPIPRLGADTR